MILILERDEQFLLQLATQVNSIPLPAVPEVYGVRLPPLAARLTAPNFTLIPRSAVPSTSALATTTDASQVAPMLNDMASTAIGVGRLAGADDGEEEDDGEAEAQRNDVGDEDDDGDDDDDDDDEEMEDVTAGMGGSGMASGDRSTATTNLNLNEGSNSESSKRKVDELDDEYD